MSEEFDNEALRRFYAEDNAAQAFLDHCANRERNQTETIVDRALANLHQEGSHFSRADIVRVFKELDGSWLRSICNRPARLVVAICLAD